MRSTKLNQNKGIRETKEYSYFPLTKFVLNKDTEQAGLNMLNRIKEIRSKIIVTDNRLRDYQKKDASNLVFFKRMGLFNEQRLGKTCTVLAAINELAKKHNFTTLIIAPKSTHYSWEQETKKWYTNSVIRLTTKTKRIKAYNEHYKVYIATYETTNLDFKNLLNLVDCVIIDEAHRMHNFKGIYSKNSPDFTKSIAKLCYKVEYLYLLTGTPTPNYAYQIIPLLNLLYPNLFYSYWGSLEYYFKTFELTYVKNSPKKVGDFINNIKKLELQEFLDIHCIQRKRKDHMKWIKDSSINIIPLKMDKKEEIWYNELDKTWECKELNIDCPNKLVLMSKLTQITSTMHTKEQFILDYIKDYPNEQIIIVGTFSSYLKKLHKKIPNSKLLIGETSALERGKLEKEFNEKKYNILIGNIYVLKEGMKLEQGQTIIVLNPSLTYSDNLQLYDRIVPTTEEVAVKKTKQQILLLIIPDTIDEYIQNQLNCKASSTSIINNFKTTRKERNYEQ